MISAAPATTDTPRSHITNMASLECLSDIGLDVEVLKAGTPQETSEHTRWCHTMSGEEYARMYCYGNGAARAVSCGIS